MKPQGLLEPVRCLVVGREGAADVGEWLTRFFLGRRILVSRLLAFDHARRITLYEVGFFATRIEQTMPGKYDTIIGLDESAVAYEELLRKRGVFLLDEGSIDSRPARQDIETMAVPAAVLAYRAVQSIPSREVSLDQGELEEAVILGSTLSVHSHYPTGKEVSRIFDPPQADNLPLTLATYAGYDWVQERGMRGKSLTVMLE